MRALGVLRVHVLWVLLLLGPGIGCKTRTPQTQELHIYAASSLTETMNALQQAFARKHPGIRVAYTFAGSQVLRLQIEQGARVDLFVSANPKHVQQLQQAGFVQKRRVFALNELVVILPRSGHTQIHSFRDISKATRLVIGTPNVPIGEYTQTVLGNAARQWGDSFAASVRSRVVSQESNVRLVRAKVELGEADAAIVYRTDALSSQKVRWIPIPAALQVPVHYEVGLMKHISSPTAAQQWFAFLFSQTGRRVLAKHGFRLP